MSTVQVIPATLQRQESEQSRYESVWEDIQTSGVSVIPATKRTIKGGGQMKEEKHLRVAAYCRVSTGDESQQTSYTNQMAYYIEYINKQEKWELAGIYADEAISGTSRVRRKEFNRMMEDALHGKIDYIVTISISRFARNTVDTLNCVRQLRQQNPPVGIYFEKENIDTLDAAGELILTILSALAQDESRSLSDNIRWAFRKNFQAGKPQINLKRMLGYDKGDNGEWVINPKQAEIVRFIFQKYVCGHSANAIAKQANDAGMRTVNEKLWTAGAVLDTLRNEKYVGDLEMQKTITEDFLSHRSVKNTGQAPKYYVKNHHIGIIDRFTWEKVQILLKGTGGKKAKDGDKAKCGPKGFPFFNLICGAVADGKECGERFMRMTYSAVASGYQDERSAGLDVSTQLEKYSYAYPVWRCKRKLGKEAKENCSSTVVQECALEQSFMEMLYWLKRDYEAKGENAWIFKEFRKVYDETYKQTRKNICSIQRMEVLEGQIKEVEENLQKAIQRQAETVREAEYISDLRMQLENYKYEKAAVEGEQSETILLKKNYDFFIECLKRLPEMNSAGMRINVNGQDVRGTMFRDINGKAKTGVRSAVHTGHIKVTPEKIGQSPDYLRFERSIYLAFIRSGKVRGDEVEYLTTFGVRLKSYGNSRKLGSFLGYRRGKEDGTIEFLDEIWKVNNRKVQYRRMERHQR